MGDGSVCIGDGHGGGRGGGGLDSGDAVDVGAADFGV